MTAKSLTRSPLLARNTVLNLLGYGTPLIVAAFAIPLIVKAMGTDRFGILTLAWVLIGYLSLLDLGLGRALTKVVSEKLGAGKIEEIPSTIWTALSAMVLFSIGIGMVFGSCSHSIVYELLKVPDALKQETLKSFWLLSVFIPVVIISVGFRGVLESYQRFDMVNAVRIPLGVFSFLAPLAVIPFTVELPAVISVLFAGRFIGAAVQFFFCCKVVLNFLKGFAIKPEMFGKLLRFGGWMTITNAMSPLLVYMDRFFIGAYLSATAVAFYATPSEVVTKLPLISGALMSVLFPAISASYNIDRRHSAFLLERGLKYVFIVILPIVLLIVSFAREGLQLWLNEQFMIDSFRVTQVLSVGIFFTCLGQIPYAFIQGANRPDLSGKLHICELPIYLLLLIVAIRWAGINGAAIAWALRSAVDSMCMYFMAQKLLGSDRLRTLSKIAGLLLALGCFALLAVITPLSYRVVTCTAIMVIYIFILLRYLLSSEEIAFAKAMVRSR